MEPDNSAFFFGTAYFARNKGVCLDIFFCTDMEPSYFCPSALSRQRLSDILGQYSGIVALPDTRQLFSSFSGEKITASYSAKLQFMTFLNNLLYPAYPVGEGLLKFHVFMLFSYDKDKPYTYQDIH
jgi:hypothetical protein